MITRRIFSTGSVAVFALTGCGRTPPSEVGDANAPQTASASARKRIAFIEFGTESNGMADPIGEEAFFSHFYLDAKDLGRALADGPKIGGFIGGALSAGGDAWEPIAVVATWGGARGPVKDSFMQAFCADIQEALKAAAPLDGVYVNAHGGSVGVVDPHPDGTLLEAVREAVGQDIPIVANHDLHGHVSKRMLSACDINIAHLENPHTDEIVRGRLAGEMLNRLMAKEIKPVTAFVRVPMICPQVTQLTADGTPYGDIIAYGHALGTESVLDISVLSGYSLTDSELQGMAVLVATDDDPDTARDIALKIAAFAWAQRRRFVPTLTPVDDAMSIIAETTRPSIFADVGDNPGGGANGNNLTVLNELWARGFENIAMGTFFDPAVVEAAFAAGVGAVIDTVLTGENDTRAITARVLGLSAEGAYRAETGIDKGSMTGIGPCAAIDVDGVHMIVNAIHEQIVDEGAFAMLGLNAQDYRSIVLKTRGHFRAAFDFVDPQDIYELDTPGLTPQNFSRVDWKRLSRPIFPLDDKMEWTPTLTFIDKV
ncbi:MAG: M81 family metallopeptidase [Pseudomonadota bacterium]